MGTGSHLSNPNLKIRKKGNKKLTFMVVSGPDSSVKDFRISAGVFKFCLTFFCMALIAVGAVSYYVLQEYLDDKVTIASLSEVNDTLNETANSQAARISELQHITDNMVSDMRNRIEEIESLNSEVRSKVGLEENADGENQIVAGYVVSRGESVLDQINESANEELDSLEDLVQELLNMDLRMTAQAMELLNLHDDVEKQLAFEAALPDHWPMDGIYMSAFGTRKNPFGRGTEFHQGIDIANKTGTKIRAAGDGVVTFAGYKSGWGRMILISHGYGYVSQYAHCSTIGVLEGQAVIKGEIIATCGSTGRTTGPHLHFGIQEKGVFIDPIKVLDSGGAKK